MLRRPQREFDRAGPVDLRYELLRDRPDDSRRRAPHALSGERSHHQHWLSAGLSAQAVRALYSATKHAVEGYSESLDHELRTRGIRVSIVEPAYTKTPIDANFLESDAKLDAYRGVRAAVNSRVKEVMQTAVGPDVVAETVLKAARATHPKVRYTAGSLAGRLRLLRRFAPAGVMDAGIRRDLRLDAPTGAI